MGRVYSVSFENVTIPATNAIDLFLITPADDKPCKLLGFVFGNVGGTADAGDAQEEFLRVLVRRGHTVAGSGGAAPTPIPLNPDDAAAGFTARVNDTTIANTGTTKDLHADGANVRIPYVWLPPPELCPRFSQADTTLVIRLVAGPADAVQMSGTCYIEEL